MKMNYMNKIDYEKIGLKCGIEIHQRLETNKLFCECPSILRDDKPDVLVKRNLRAVVGETGEIDVAAAQETEKEEYHIYEAYSDTTCLVEMDEEPPHQINKKALGIVLQVCKMLNSKIVDEIQVMRKTVVNGSNTSGFQRTAMVAEGGFLEVDNKKIGIQKIFIEEESAKDVEKGTDKEGKRYVIYRLDRLGVPLIEIGTEPEIKTPEQCKKVAEKIGMILRSTGKVARGIGTIRQDLNISIKDGERVEIKGAQELKTIPEWIKYEVKRQVAMSELAKEVKKRINEGKISIDQIKKEKVIDVSKIFKDTACKFIRDAKESKEAKEVYGIKLSGFAELLGRETQPGKRVGTEISDYAKVKTGIGGIIHSDEDLKKYLFSDKEIHTLKKELKCDKEDAFVIIIAKKEKAERAFGEVKRRALMCKDGVIKEVRQPNQDGTTSYMRAIPGQARLYPETDVVPIKPDIKEIKIPELLDDKKERFVSKFKLSEDLARDLSRSGKYELFERFCKNFGNIKPAFIAETLLSMPRNLKRKYKLDALTIKDSDFEKVFELLNEEKITKNPIEEILVEIAKGKKVDYEKYATLDHKKLEEEIKKILKESEEIEFEAVVGKVMETLKGKADGKKIIETLKKLTK